MSEFDQMLDESIKTIKTGEVIKGTIISVRDDDIVVNIGYKHDGILAKSELTNDPAVDLHELYHAGDEIEARVSKVNDGEGNVLLTMKRGFGGYNDRVSQVIMDAFENKTVLTAVVDEIVNKGLTVTVDGVKVFIPASMVTDPFESDLSKYLGQEISFLISDYVPKKHRVIGDRKSLILKEREEALQHILETLHEGDVIDGTVKSFTDFGAFIDLGGADGLLHITEMSWSRVGSPKKLFKLGDTVRVFVKSINGKKIGLSRKFPDENPWANAEEKYAVGTVVTGKVARLTDFGAFVNLQEGIDGLVHVSQIMRERVEKPSDVLELGQEVTAKVIALDTDEKKISLSMRALLPKPEHQDRPDRRGRGNRAPREESFENEDGTVNIEKYIAKLDREEAMKAKAEAGAAAEEAKEAAEAVAEEAKETAEAVVEEAKETAEAAVEEVKETAEAVAEEAKETAEEAVAEVKEAVEEKKEAAEAVVAEAKEIIAEVKNETEA